MQRLSSLFATIVLLTFFCMGYGENSKKPVMSAKQKKETQTPKPTGSPKSKKSKKKKSKKKESNSKLKAPKKLIRDMNYDELKTAKAWAVQEKSTELCIKYLEKMIPMCNNLQELSGIMLELADLLFDTGSLDKAGKMYKEFTKLYPGNKRVEYASYKAILCNFYAMLDAERDQTKTQDTIELAKDFLKQSDTFKIHVADVEKILLDCHKRLFEHEGNVFKFYVHRGSYTSAHKRLDHMRANLLSHVPAFEAQILAYECELAEKENQKELLAQKQKELQEKFPSDFQKITLAKAEKRSFMHRF